MGSTKQYPHTREIKIILTEDCEKRTKWFQVPISAVPNVAMCLSTTMPTVLIYGLLATAPFGSSRWDPRLLGWTWGDVQSRFLWTVWSLLMYSQMNRWNWLGPHAGAALPQIKCCRHLGPGCSGRDGGFSFLAGPVREAFSRHCSGNR